MEAINNKAMKGIRTFLERRGMEILETGWAHGNHSIDYIARDEGELVFTDCQIRENAGKGLGGEDINRDKFEQLAAAYLAEHQDTPEGTVRFDVVTMLTLSDHKALLRHHRNALGISEA